MNADLKELAKKYQPTQPKGRKPFDAEKLAHHGARYSPCGNFLIAGGHEGQIFRWAVVDDLVRPLAPLAGHSAWVQAYDFAPAGKRLFTADSWGRLRAWDYSAWPIATIKEPVAPPVEAKDDKLAKDKKPPVKKEEPKPELVVTTESGAALKPLWDIADAHDGWIRAIAVRPDGQQIATCGRDQVIRIWDAATGKKLQELTGQGDDTFVLRWHPQGKDLLAGDGKGMIKDWQPETGKVLREFDAKVLAIANRLQDVGGVRALAFDNLGETLITGGTKPVNGGNVQGTPLVLVYNWASGKQTGELTLGAQSDVYVCDLRYDPRGYFIASTSGNPGTGKLQFFRTTDKEPFFVQAIGNCHAVTLQPAGQKLAATTFVSSGGNGRGKDDGKRTYLGGYSPVQIFDLPGESQAS